MPGSGTIAGTIGRNDHWRLIPAFDLPAALPSLGPRAGDSGKGWILMRHSQPGDGGDIHYDPAVMAQAMAALGQVKAYLHGGNNAYHEAVVMELGNEAPIVNYEKPPVEWSRPFSKKKLAALLGCPAAKKADWLNQCVEAGLYRIRPCTRQSYQIDLATVPPELRNSLRNPK